MFFDQQLVYEAERKGIWLGEQRSHGAEGYLEFIQELLGGEQRLLAIFVPILLRQKTVHIQSNDRCPCGSGRKYKRCHKASIEEIQKRVGSVALQMILGKLWQHSTK